MSKSIDYDYGGFNYRYNNGLTRRHTQFCEAYLQNGHNVSQAARSVGYGGNNYKAAACAGWGILKKPEVKQYINERVKAVEEETQIGFKEKYNKLWQVATVSTPDEAITKNEIDGRTTVSAISEMNKMSGDISPERKLNVNVNADEDLRKLLELQQKLLEQNKKDY